LFLLCLCTIMFVMAAMAEATGLWETEATHINMQDGYRLEIMSFLIVCSHAKVKSDADSNMAGFNMQDGYRLEIMSFLMAKQDSEWLQKIFRYYADISACEKFSEWQLALGLIVSGSATDYAYAGGNGYEQSVLSYNAAFSACEKSSEWQLALGMLGGLRSAELQTVTCYNAAISACEKSSEWQLALGLIGEMHSAELQLVSDDCYVGGSATGYDNASGNGDIYLLIYLCIYFWVYSFIFI